ncbi:GNAT family N-acetyltransferase [Algoriphagus mannitolivorans]|uniref:GNAT family N-acetyltransferase n=1 Tax=Algoriphagus mannitolivorans TaxID=226504 RepID=UPI0003F932DC|nr:GNAT family N-acetyltransferase [Algoriphagus mannitolivorans]
MEIRKSNPEDIPAIVDLLRLSLGESLLPKSIELWNWKHIENPFGPSPVLLATENEQIIGVRSFLRWDFANLETTIKACRAVDTAVHPDFQGKGVFTKLTLGLIDEIRNEGLDTIFNTPNEKSTPGYIKLGWEKAGKLPLFLGFRLATNSNSRIPDSDWNQIRNLIEKLEFSTDRSTDFSTQLKPGFLSWRYENCPLFPYYFLSDGRSFLLVFRIKEGKWGNEFRICDFYTLEEFGHSSEQELQKMLQEAILASGCRMISYSGLKSNHSLGMKFLPKLSLGPLVTLRQIQHGFVPKEHDWAWSIGDLEVF